MTDETPLTFPELWALERLDAADRGVLVRPYDNNPGHKDQGALVYFSFAAADLAAAYQWENYDVRCIPRRITAEPIDQPANH